MSIYVLFLDNQSIHFETFSSRELAEQTAAILIEADVYSTYEIIETVLV